MLILTRRTDEIVDLIVEVDGGDSIQCIEVRVLGISGNQVRLGFKASDSVKIIRRELNTKMFNPL